MNRRKFGQDVAASWPGRKPAGQTHRIGGKMRLPHGFEAFENISSNQYINQALAGVSPDPSFTEKTLDWGKFRIEAVAAVPSCFHLVPFKTVCWIATETGHWAQLEGASQLYRGSPDGVIAFVKYEARLRNFDGETYVPLSAGLWRIWPPQDR